MVSESRGLAVMEELKSLIREVRDSMKLIPGSDRLVRACSKELHHFAKLPPSRLDNAASCSNLPHFRAIAKLGQAYGDRVTGMMCRFRMPPSSGRVQNSMSQSENLFEVLEGGSDLLTPRYQKTESVLVDLVCIQHPREPIICPGFCSPSEQGESEPESEPQQRRKRQQQQSCPGNASDADCWAPSLWIKVVTRDASRLNAAWLGEASSSRAACLYRQMKELVTTASWYQRGQPANWIRAVIHWIPQSNADATTALDPGLLDALTQLNVYLLPHSRSWFAATHSTPPQPEVTNNDSLQNPTTLSLQKHMANLGIFRRALLSVWTKPTDLESRCDSVSLLESALRDALSRRSSNGYSEDLNLDAQLTNLAVLDAVLHLSIRPPFSHEVLNSLDSHHRVNLDVSAMVALASELSQFLPDPSIISSHDPSLILGALESPQRRENLIKQPRFKCNTLGWLLESEAERPVLTAIHQHIRGAVVLVCRTAALSFLRILVTVAGEREWFRGLYLLSQVILVPDLVFSDSPSVAANKENPRPTQSNRRKTQLIMDVGNAFGALTITANEAFLRSLRNKGLKHVALLVPARALTETAARDDL